MLSRFSQLQTETLCLPISNARFISYFFYQIIFFLLWYKRHFLFWKKDIRWIRRTAGLARKRISRKDKVVSIFWRKRSNDGEAIKMPYLYNLFIFYTFFFFKVVLYHPAFRLLPIKGSGLLCVAAIASTRNCVYIYVYTAHYSNRYVIYVHIQPFWQRVP